MRILPKKLVLKNFRNFRNVDIELGNKLTIISGANGVGKSNIISLIASGSGISKRSYLGSNFQPEFDQFFNIEKNEQYQDYKIYLRYKSSDGKDALDKRLSFKDDTETNRGIRIIPRTTNEFVEGISITNAENKAKKEYGVGGAARVHIPTIYLSLSRLYPLGEQKEKTHVTRIRKSNIFAQDEIRSIFRTWYNRVIPGAIKEEAEMSIVQKQASSRASLHMDMEGTPTLSQSIGQDNVGNIISALVDLFILSKSDDYNGALLCIDEIEVSLHPETQIRLLNLLVELCDVLSLQVVVSTHSLTILKEGLSLEKRASEDYNIIYLKNPSMPIPTSVKSYDVLKADMFDKVTYHKVSPKIYFEDEVGKVLFAQHINAMRILITSVKDSGEKEILRNSDKIANYEEVFKSILECEEILAIEKDLKQIVTHCGCDELFGISGADEYFNRVIINLDGDARIKRKDLQPHICDYLDRDFNPKDKNITERMHKPNIIFSPGYFAPESYIYSIFYKLIKNQGNYIDFWRGVDQNEELSLFTSDRLKKLFSGLENAFNNDDIKSIFGEDPDQSEIWNFIIKSDMIPYYYKDYVTVHEIIDFAHKIIIAYKMTKSLTVANRYS